MDTRESVETPDKSYIALPVDLNEIRWLIQVNYENIPVGWITRRGYFEVNPTFTPISFDVTDLNNIIFLLAWCINIEADLLLIKTHENGNNTGSNDNNDSR